MSRFRTQGVSFNGVFGQFRTCTNDFTSSWDKPAPLFVFQSSQRASKQHLAVKNKRASQRSCTLHHLRYSKIKRIESSPRPAKPSWPSVRNQKVHSCHVSCKQASSSTSDKDRRI
mmetsp:Transcript_10584/g.20615  ORF Transcript_10584/g.20615 Transcript_10584/m.20615 type:complete len:115 (-) Transcript_10584:58-402(-)